MYAVRLKNVQYQGQDVYYYPRSGYMSVFLSPGAGKTWATKPSKRSSHLSPLLNNLWSIIMSEDYDTSYRQDMEEYGFTLDLELLTLLNTSRDDLLHQHITGFRRDFKLHGDRDSWEMAQELFEGIFEIVKIEFKVVEE